MTVGVPFGSGLHRLCGAQGKRSGLPCGGPAMVGKNRCRFHGGRSTGPNTVEGKAKIAARSYKHGRYTKEGVELRRQWRQAARRLEKIKW